MGTYSYIGLIYWQYFAELTRRIGVIAACIPSLRPLVAFLWKGSHKGPTIFSKKSAQATTSSGSSRMAWPGRDEELVGGFTRLEDGMPRDQSRDRWGHDVNVHGGWKDGRSRGEDEVSLQEMRNPGIKVKHEVTVTSEAWDYKDRLY